MILPAQTIRRLCRPPEMAPSYRPMISPFCERTVGNGMTFGLSAAGYDLRIAEDRMLVPGAFALASTVERFVIPPDILMQIVDKSTWARRGLAVQNTVAEPGWEGWLTIELSNHGNETLLIPAGSPIAQGLFHRLESRTDLPYPADGKYQNQEAGPQPARDARAGGRA